MNGVSEFSTFVYLMYFCPLLKQPEVVQENIHIVPKLVYGRNSKMRMVIRSNRIIYYDLYYQPNLQLGGFDSSDY